MPLLMMYNAKEKLDKDLRAKVFTFLGKLQEDDTAPGLHVEPMHNPADSRVRTGRVDQAYRAVLFKVTGKEEVMYVYVGTWHHDEGIEKARKSVLSFNPHGGFPEIEERDDPSTPGEAPASESGSTALNAKPWLAELGFSAEELVRELGLSEATARRALAALTAEDLLEVAVSVDGWQGEALMLLLDGMAFETIRAKLGLDEAVEHDDADDDVERLKKASKHPLARASFTYVDSSEELRQVIEAGDFGAWRIFLHPEQRRYATKSYNGAFRLSGGAGTGKTVVLVHRARELWKANPDARIVLTTYTKNLADMLASNLRQLDTEVPIASAFGESGVYIANIDALIARVLKSAGADVTAATSAVLGRPVTHVNNRTDDGAWQAAIDSAGADLPEALKSPGFFSAEYSMVVLPARITNRADYFTVARPGRGVALNRAGRAHVWSVIDAYRASANIDGVIDYEEAAAVAAAHVDLAGGVTRFADHVLVDEGQDLTPARWQFLRALAPEGADDLFIAEDSHQRIYGQKVVLGRYGIKIVGRSQRLTLNYRTTEQNLRWAVAVLAGAEYSDVEGSDESTAGYHSARLGPVPELVPCTSVSDEYDAVAERVRTWIDDEGVAPEAIAVLVRDKSTQARMTTALGDRGVTAQQVDRGSIKAGHPSVLTMHRAKGTEFERVVLAGVADGAVPAAMRSEQYSEESLADAMLRERSLLYVAATRARDVLVVTWSGIRSTLIGPQSD
ncbi:3'-5' exonuclease [Demequina lignilytica]|uniref:DNA 3'-5' helicase n=1 Tax=Demequina lignilytica TaxID=3051663 RepID=A0AB35MHD7_9MICO|nr:3'-5' exonuclease [Demequina sp. SYSU T0a273]MDN4483204.1 3'-5' exonuclease [Demequina sp. SYSU T0a273]